ncbi:MAG: hypothetical protein V3U98_03870 [Acidobacteriota bacterium]
MSFLVPALLIFLAVTILARILRRRETEETGRAARRIAALEDEVRELRRRLDRLTALPAETVHDPTVLPPSSGAPGRAG